MVQQAVLHKKMTQQVQFIQNMKDRHDCFVQESCYKRFTLILGVKFWCVWEEVSYILFLPAHVLWPMLEMRYLTGGTLSPNRCGCSQVSGTDCGARKMGSTCHSQSFQVESNHLFDCLLAPLRDATAILCRRNTHKPHVLKASECAFFSPALVPLALFSDEFYKCHI